MTRTRFVDWVAARFTEPAEALAAYFDDAVHAAASVGATLDHLPELNGVRHFLPNAQGRNDKKQFCVASVEADKDGTAWPCITFKSYKGATSYWKPRDRAFQEFMTDRGAVPANDHARKDYRAAAAAAVAAANAKAAAHEQRQAEGRAAATAAAMAAWDAAEPCTGHSYLESKGVRAHDLRVASQGLQARLWNDAAQEWQTVTAIRAGDLLVPMRDEGGHLVNIQRIDSAGKKRFIMGGRAHGCHHRIEGTTGRTVLCEGYATGSTWHAAMGDSVVLAFSAGALAAVAAYIKPDAIAADNDQSQTGEKAAKSIGLPYHMPPLVGMDWNDYAQAHGLEAIRAAVANDNAPAFTRPYALPVVELKGREQTWWNKLSAATTAADAAAISWAIARRLVVRVPVVMPLSAIMDQVRDAAPAGMLNPATIDAIRAALVRMLDWRKARALAGIRMSPETLSRHEVEAVDALTPGTLHAADYQGVILLNTPMGSGKTEHIGKPFANWSKRQDARFVATCHRQSLVAELARMLGTDHYQGVGGEEAWAVDALATCLPSIVKDAHAQIVSETGYLFVDEIAQVLRSVAGSATVADKKTRADVFRTLRDLVGRARCIIGADAGMDDRVIAFLESCRPGERFRIIRQRHRAEDLTVSFGFGPDALATAYGEAMARLSQGERLWIACGEKTRAMEAARVLAGTGARILLLHGDNRENSEQAEFWRAPEATCLAYDVVIASPVVSSGLSIKHRGIAQHFTHGMLLASGATITPADAIQMLRRVRYLQSWTVAVLPNNAHDIDNADAILAGMEQAAGLEGLPAASCSEFDAFVAGVHADEARQRADFAAGLWWALQHQGFRVQRMAVQADGAMAAELKATRAAIREEQRAAILAAPELDDMQARRLRDKPSRTESEQAALLRYRVRTDLCLNDADVDGEALNVWDDGRGPRRLDRFSAATMRLADRHDHGGQDLALHRFGKARALAYSWLLDGLELAPGMRVDQDTAAELIGRVIERRHLLAFLGIAPAKWARDVGAKPFPAPAYPVREVSEILERMWLELRRREVAATPTWADSPLAVITPCGGKTGRNRVHELTAASWERASIWAERRNKGRQTARAEAANDQTVWDALRAELWARAGDGALTWEDACTHLENAWVQRGRRWSYPARVARWWAGKVLRPSLAA